VEAGGVGGGERVGGEEEEGLLGVVAVGGRVKELDCVGEVRLG